MGEDEAVGENEVVGEKLIRGRDGQGRGDRGGLGW